MSYKYTHMKKLFISLLSICSLAAYAQSTPPGIIAHWDMNGSTNDVTGNGHNGHGNNLTPAAGQDGVMGHAWYFNGINSSITVPYSPAFNVAKYTIAAKIKAQGFYTGTCHGNIIFQRARSNGPDDAMYLVMSDYPAGYGCTTAMDTTKESFITNAWSSGSVMLGPTSYSSYDYTPHIAENVWYNVVASFNDTVFKIYVNGALAVTVPTPYAGTPVGTGMDSVQIGMDVYEAAAGYPYNFHGVMDDIQLYDRALTDSEAVHLFDTCGTVTTEPVSATASVGSTVKFIAHSSIPTAGRQWQQNSGTGFVNLSNAGVYSGVATDTLTITGVMSSLNGDLYRCVVANESSCTDTSTAATLTVPLGVNDLDHKQHVTLHPNPTHGSIEIVATTSLAEISIFNVLGQVVYSAMQATDHVTVNVACLPAGIYYLRANGAYAGKFQKE